MLTNLYDAVFISDLHLHPDETAISQRFERFITWAASHTKTLYILGDFFHAWPGDDGLDVWSLGVAKRLKWLSEQGVLLFFMHGNRDFLLGERFFELSGMALLKDPTLILLDEMPVLLTHGDRYCTKDKKHQWLRRITRNQIFPWFFLKLPFKLRNHMVQGVRRYSQSLPYDASIMEVVNEAFAKHLLFYHVTTLIHGHTHKPGLYVYQHLNRYVLSDWDDSPQILCYDKSKGLHFIHEIC